MDETVPPTLSTVYYPITFSTKVCFACSHNHIDVGNAGSYEISIRNITLSSLDASYIYTSAKGYFLLLGY